MPSEFIIAIDGAVWGAWLMLAISISSYLAEKWSPPGTVIDIIIRGGTIALLTLPAAHLFGQTFGPQVRHYAVWFWASFAISYMATPSLLDHIFKRNEPAE